MTNKLKFLFLTAILIILVGSTFMALFGGGRVLDSVLKTYVLKVETCQYKSVPRVAEVEFVEPEQECFIDYNQAKGDIAGGLALLIVSLPVAGFTFRQARRNLS